MSNHRRFPKCETCGTHGHRGTRCPVYALNQEQEGRHALRRESDHALGLTPTLEREIARIRTAWRIGLAATLCLLLSVAGWAGTITGQLQTATGGVVANGTLTFKLNQPAVLAGTASIVTQSVSCYLSSAGNIVGVPDPLALPIVSTNTASGTLPAGTYYLKITYTGGGGESVPSPEAVAVLTGAGTLIVSPPNLQPAAATGYDVYISSTTGTETKQGGITGFTSYSQSSGLSAGGALPSSNSSACSLYFSDQLIPTGTAYSVSLVNKNGSTIAGFPQTWCTYGGQSGTINVSNGAPTGNCGTNGVFYPTPLFSSVTTPQSIGGSFFVKSLNNIQFADQFAGVTADVQINAAILALPSTGGTVDARGFGSSGQTIAATVNVGSIGKPVRLLLGPTTFTCTIPNGSACWSIANGSRLSGTSGSSTFLTTSATANVSAVVTNADHSGAQEFFYLDNASIGDATGATIGHALVELQSVFVNSYLSDTVITNCSGIGLWMRNNTNGAGLGPVNIRNTWVDCFGNSGARPVVIASAGAGSGGINVTWSGGAIEHAGAGNILLEINGSPNNTITGTAITSVYLESSFNNTIGIDLIGAQHVLLEDIKGGGVGGGTSTLVQVDNGSGGASYANTFLGLNQGNGFANTLVDNTVSKTFTGYLPIYNQPNPAASQGSNGSSVLTVKSLNNIQFADQFATIQAAITAACNGTVQGQVFITTGLFSLGTTALSVPNNCDIAGSGQATTTLQLSSGATTSHFVPSSSSPTNIRIHDMTLDGSSGTSAAEGCVNMNQSTTPTDITIERVTCQNVGASGFNVTGTTANPGKRVKVINSKVLNAGLICPGAGCAGAGQLYGILVSGNSHVQVLDNEITGGGLTSGIVAFSGINASSATPIVEIQVIGNRIHDLPFNSTPGTAIDIGRARQATAANNVIYNLGQGGCVTFEAIWGGTISGNACSIADAVITGGPILVKTPDTTQSGEVASQDISISGNSIIDATPGTNSCSGSTVTCHNAAIGINGAARNVTIANNAVSVLNQPTDGYNSIYLQVGTNDANISGASQNFCNIFNVSGNTLIVRPGPGTTASGIAIQQVASGCVLDQVVATGNTVNGFKNAISISGTAASNGVTDTRVQGNNLINNTNGFVTDGKTYSTVFYTDQLTGTIASGTATLTTGAITAGNCGTTVTVTAAGVLTTDTITWAFNAAPAGSNAGLVAWPTAGNVNFAYCPNSAETPASATANWRVVR